MTDAIQATIDEALNLAVGDDTNLVDAGDPFLNWVVYTSDLVPPWWSRSRDRKLAAIWKESNHLSIAVYNTLAKIVGIPPKIVSVDESNAEHVEASIALENRLFTTADFGRGWEILYSKFIESLITQDNGAFMEVIGDGPPDGPIIGAPLAFRHLDSASCTRTGNPLYPVIYTDTAGQRFKLYWTRVIYMSQMPSIRRSMHGVGFSAISRSVEISQTLIDIIRYKQERLGSRPQSQLLIGKGITAEQIKGAFSQAEDSLSNRGFTRYAKTIAIGSGDSTDIDVTKIDLNHMDPFDEETSMNLGMFAISAAFGMDADELWPVGGKSAGKQEANLRRMRSRGRLPAQVTSEFAAQFNYKVLPPHLKLVFDFRDDEEDMQRANIKDIRGRNRERDLGTGSINVRAARVRMLKDGDIDRVSLEQTELTDGRLPDGTPISILYYADDPTYINLLRFMDKPLSFAEHIFTIDPILGGHAVDEEALNAILEDIQNQRAIVLEEWAKTKSAKKADKIKRSFWALDWLEQQYNFAAGRILPEVPMQQRRQRTDIRVKPAEDSPQEGEQSSAQAGMPIDENIEAVGGG